MSKIDRIVKRRFFAGLKFFLVGFMMMGAVKGWGQTVFSDDFSRTTGLNGAGMPTTYSVSGSGTQSVLSAFSASQGNALQLKGAASTSASEFVTGLISSYTSPYTSVLSSNTGLITWTLNVQTSRTNTFTGFTGTSYGQAIVLAGTSSSIAATGNGYALVYGGSTFRNYRLVKYSGGIQGTLTDLITSGTNDFSGGANFLSLKVTYDPSTNTWKYYFRDDGATDWTNAGTGTFTQIGSTSGVIDNTYTSSTMTTFGFWGTHANPASQPTFNFDNFKVIVAASCTPPTAQATFNSFANITTSQADINFTAGTGGIGRLIAAAQASSIAGSPSSGTSYAGFTTDFSSTQTIATGEKVIYKNNGTSTTLTGLFPEQQYSIKVFEYNTSDCYIISGTGNTGSFYTLSTEPSAHAASFTCNASAYNQIDLTFSAASTIANADGYIILQKQGSAPTGLPADATAYTVGATIGDATVAAIVNSASATTQAITGLTATTNYYYTLIPYNALGTGTITATYNYLTTATIPVSNCTTPSTPPSIAVSASTLTGFTYVQSAGPSASQTYNISGTNLSPASGNINIAASANFEVSADNTTFSSSSVNIAYTGGALAATPVYVRLKAGLAVGSYSSELIANTGGGASVKNVTVSGTVTGSGTSNIIEDGDASFYVPNTVNIPYTTWQSPTITNTTSGANGSIGVFRFKIQDGGASSPDADALPTIVTGITFNYTGTANTIRTAALFSGSGKVADVTTVNANSLVFSTLTDPLFTVADNGSQVLTLRVTFNTTVTDNDKLVYSVGSAASASAVSSSQFGTISATSDNNTGNDRNRIEVTADRLRFTTQPADQSVNTNLTAFVIKATDINNTVDLDAVNSVTLTTSGTGMTSSSPYTLGAGVISIADVQFNTVQGAVTITATTTGLTINTVTSTTFNITAIIYANNDYRSVTSGTWLGTSTATWEKYTLATNTWTSAPAPSSSTASTLYISSGTTITSGSSFGNTVNIKVLSGGTFNSVFNATANSVYISDGGTFSMSSNPLQINAGFEIEDNGTFIFNYSANAGATLTGSLWNGTENFHPNSNFIIKDHKTGAGNYFLPASGVITEQTYNGITASFGNLIIDLGSAGDNNTLRFNNGNLNNKILTHHDLIFRTANTSTNVNMYYAASTLIINGNLKIESTFTKDITLSTSAIAATLTINGDLINESSNAFNVINNTAGNAIINVNGNITQTSGSGKINLNATSGAAIATVVNLKGDLLIGATSLLTATSTTPTTFNFVGIGDGLTAATTQSISIASTGPLRNQYINFFAKAGSYVQLADQDLQLGTNSTFTVNGSGSTGGTLDFSFNGTTPLNITSYSSGTQFKTFQAATLKITSPAGISATSGTSGNVQVTNAPVYDGVGIFYYLGKTDQSTGTGLPYASSAKLIYVNLSDNTKTLTLTPQIGTTIGISGTNTLDPLGGKLEIQKGIVLGTATGDFTGSGRLVMSDGEYRISTILSPVSNTLPQLSNYSAYALTGGIVNLNGANAIQILAGTPNYYKVTFSGSNTLGTNYKGISSATSVASGITVAETAIADVKSFALGGTGTSFTMTDNSRYITDGGGTKPDASGAYSLASTTTIEFANSTGAGVIRLGTTAIDYANIIVSGTNVSNTSTGTGIKFLSTGTFTVKTGGIFKLFNTAGFSNTGGSNATALSNLSPSNPAVTLETGSTIDYAGAAQTITNVTGYQNLVLSNTGTKTAPSGTLTVNGDFSKTAAAAFDHNSGTAAFLGTAAQAYNSTPSVTDFYNVTTNNNAGLTINNNMSVANELALTGSAKLKVAAGDITLKSTAGKTASFAAMPATASITYTGSGLFYVERYINSGRKWRFLAINTNTSQTINAAWQDGQAANVNGNSGNGIIITDASATAPGVNGFDQSSFTPSMKYFDPAINDYTGVSGTGINIGIRGAYMTFVRGDRGCTPANSTVASTVLKTKGTLKTGDTTISLTNAGDFAAIGNPYASRVSISSLVMNNLQDYIYIWDPKIAGANSLGGFQTLQKIGGVWKFPVSLGGSYPSGINVAMDSIESGQAFFVRALAAGGSIKFTESAKAAGSNNVNFTSGQPGSLAAVLKNASGTAVDGAVVEYADQNSNSTDLNDASKMANTSENVSIKSVSLLAVEQRKTVAADDTIHINVTGYKVGNYQWTFTLTNMDAPGLTGFVKDNFLNILTPLNMTGDNDLSFTISNTAGSYAADRFMIIFKPSSVVAVTVSSISAQRNADKSIQVNWRSETESGIDHYEIQRSANGNSFQALGTQAATNNAGGVAAYTYKDLQPFAEMNYYRIKAIGTSGEVKYTAIVKVLPINETASFSVYPNPVKDKTIHLQAAGQEAGDYKVQLISNTGQVIYKAIISVSGNVFVKDIILPANTAAGNYKLSVTNAAGNTMSQNILVE